MTLVTLVGTTGVLVYFAYQDKNPGPQQPFDDKKKTIVVVGSGWGATSFLRKLDTEDYNVVRAAFISMPIKLTTRVDCGQPQELLPLHAFASVCCRRHNPTSVYYTVSVPSM